MSVLSAVINRVEDEVLREQFQERVEIIQHKIKFMDKVPVAFLDTENRIVRLFEELSGVAGGELKDDPLESRVVIYREKGVGMLQLMGAAPAMLQKEWPAVEYDRVYLWDDAEDSFADAELAVTALEDLAEMFYPGYFVFGNEGRTWMSFKTQ